jgi:hypothetical protein
VIRIIIPLAIFAVWIFALVDALTVPDDSMYRTGNKLIWVIVIVFTWIIGAVIYLLIGRPLRERPQRPPSRPPPDDVI